MTVGNRTRRDRERAKLTDERGTLGEILNQVDQCVFCHEREKDSCSTGFTQKDGSVRAKLQALGESLA